MGLAFFTRINPNLLVPVVIVFLLVSTTSRKLMVENAVEVTMIMYAIDAIEVCVQC